MQELRVTVVRHHERQRDAVLREPPWQMEGNSSHRIHDCAYQCVSLVRVHPAVKPPAFLRVTHHCCKAGVRILEMMQDADAINDVERTEVRDGQIAPMQFS